LELVWRAQGKKRKRLRRVFLTQRPVLNLVQYLNI